MQQGDALLIVDVQNDFCPGGALGVAGGDAVARTLSDQARQFADAGLPVAASRDWHPEHTRHFISGGGPWPPHCVQGTPGADFHPDLELPAGTAIISKGMSTEDDGYSAFEGQTGEGEPLTAWLRERGVRRLFVGGLATDYCVRASVLDALADGFAVVLLTDAMHAVDVQPGDGDRALAEMRTAGSVEQTVATAR